MELYFSILSSIILCILLTIISMHVEHRIIDDRMENYGAYIVFISKEHCRTTMKNILADRIVQQTADCVGVGWLQNFLFS